MDKRAEFRHFDRLRVRWVEVDMQKIVFNGHYLMYFDTAVAGYWRALALPYHDTMQQLQGDLFRPWQNQAASFERLSWTVIEPAQVAVLDEALAARAREIPQLMQELTERAHGRGRGAPAPQPVAAHRALGTEGLGGGRSPVPPLSPDPC